MHVTLDTESWDVADHLSLMEVLGQISDRATERKRIVTSLAVGGKPISDHDLDPAFLAQTGGQVGPVEASTKSLDDIFAETTEIVRQFETYLRTEGDAVVSRLRNGAGGFHALDAWFGPLADYVEMRETMQIHVDRRTSGEPLATWIQELVEARTVGDPIRVADVLEYEVLPRLDR